MPLPFESAEEKSLQDHEQKRQKVSIFALNSACEETAGAVAKLSPWVIGGGRALSHQPLERLPRHPSEQRVLHRLLHPVFLCRQRVLRCSLCPQGVNYLNHDLCKVGASGRGQQAVSGMLVGYTSRFATAASLDTAKPTLDSDDDSV